MYSVPPHFTGESALRKVSKKYDKAKGLCVHVCREQLMERGVWNGTLVGWEWKAVGFLPGSVRFG